MFTQSVGTEPTAPHRCQWCYKQYATKAKLLQHQRSVHKELLTEPAKKAHHEGKAKAKKDVQIPAISTTSPPVKVVDAAAAAVVNIPAANGECASGDYSWFPETKP